MTVTATALGSPHRNGMPGSGGYVYRGTGRDETEPPPQRGGRPRRGRQPAGARRVLAALRSLGGSASTPEIRLVMELDGGRPYHPGYVNLVLTRLSRADPPEVTRCGTERNGSGHPARWELGPGGAS